jgi:hypothetical protein
VSRFAKLLALIAVAALAVRWLYDVHIRDFAVLGDALTFHHVAQGLADGRGFHEYLPPGGPTAEHPPMMELFLAAVDRLGFNSFLAHRLALGVVGTATVVLLGLLGRRVGGERVGLVAAGLAAIYPMLWTADGSLMSETLYGFFLVATLLAACWVRDAPSWRRAAALGALIAAAALTRGEALSLVVLIAVPLAIAARPTWRSRGALWAATALAFVCVLAPWTIFNATRFSTPVLISTNSNGVFVGANCPETYSGPLIGAWRFQCYTPRRPGEDEAEYFARQRHIGIEYAVHHTGRWPAVVAARVGRLLDVYRFDQSVFFNTSEGRPATQIRWGIRCYWVVALLALGGIAVLARRRAYALLVLGAPLLMVLLVGVFTYGGTRFRFGAEPSLVVLAAVAIVAAGDALLRRRAAGRAPAGASRPDAPPGRSPSPPAPSLPA